MRPHAPTVPTRHPVRGHTPQRNHPATNRRPPPRALPDDDPDRPSTNPLAQLAGAVQSMFDFESWAPRSSRAWRLRQTLDDGGGSYSDDEGAASDGATDASMDVLNERLAAARRSRDDSDDSDVDDVLDQVVEAADDDEPSTPAPPLTGRELGAAVLTKYGRPYDVALVRRDLAGIRVVAFNVMWSYLGQKSFALTPEGYADRLDTIASILTAWGCAGEVRAWLAEPARPKRGLPARPVVGNAVSLRLSVDYRTAGEWLDG